MPEPSVPVLDVAEDILCCPKEEVTSLFGGRCYVGAEQARALASTFRGPKASFRPREEVESDGAVLQALPVVVVRNADGDVLRLRRREKNSDNPLHDKVVIWAGGHVRCEDADNGDPLVHCAIRELEEELRLQIETSSLHCVGATYFANGDRTSKHVGIVFEWQSRTNEIAAVLSRSEFFERSGTSLSGSFASVHQLAEDAATCRRRGEIQAGRAVVGGDRSQPPGERRLGRPFLEGSGRATVVETDCATEEDK